MSVLKKSTELNDKKRVATGPKIILPRQASSGHANPQYALKGSQMSANKS